MTQARETQVSLESTPFYHCYVRCVRKAYLCGEDYSTGENYDHRKQWIVSRLKFLSYIYAIDICAYAVMSNHYHVVLHVDKARALEWSLGEVAERWLQLYKAPILVERWLEAPSTLSEAELETVRSIIEVWRKRLHDLSWFMKGVNETIARMANEEEGTKGRFWEGRFKSQALLDESALLSCMAYVDLNPVRAGMEPDLVSSDFTSIQQRLFNFASRKRTKSPEEKTLVKRVNNQVQLEKELNEDTTPKAALMPFDGSSHTGIHVALPFTRGEYFDLVDKTGRLIRQDKKGFISSNAPPILKTLGIRPDKWLDQVQNFGRRYGSCAGRVARMQDYAEYFGKRWVKGVGVSSQLAA